MQIKPGVNLEGICPEMVLAAIILSHVYNKFGYDCTITSANDSEHMGQSLHYKGRALDFRTRDVAAGAVEKIVETAKSWLGKQYDVVLEKDHIHVEFDPK